MRRSLTSLLLLSILTGCAVGTPMGQVQVGQSNGPTVRDVMNGPNQAWNCYVSGPQRCFEKWRDIVQK